MFAHDKEYLYTSYTYCLQNGKGLGCMQSTFSGKESTISGKKSTVPR